MGRDRVQTLGLRAMIAFDVLVPVAIGAALVIFLILIFASSSTRSKQLAHASTPRASSSGL